MAARVFIQDIRNAGHCTIGARRWFEGYDLDFRQFLKEGALVSDMRKLNDGLMNKVLDRLEKENG